MRCPGSDSPVGGAHRPQTGPLGQPETEPSPPMWPSWAVPLQSAGQDWLEARSRSAEDKSIGRRNEK